jgi:hypothetical protein
MEAFMEVVEALIILDRSTVDDGSAMGPIWRRLRWMVQLRWEAWW